MSQNGVTLTINGRQYAAKPRDYVVQIDHDNVALSTAFGTLQLDPSSPFVMTDRFVYDSTDPQELSPGLAGQYECGLQVTDTTNGYQWSNLFVPRSAFARDRTHGYKLPQPITLDANSQLRIQLQNPATGAASGTTTVILQGYSLYEPLR